MKSSKIFIALGALVLTASAFVTTKGKKIFTRTGYFNATAGVSGGGNWSNLLLTLSNVSGGQQYFTVNSGAPNARAIQIKTSLGGISIATLRTTAGTGSVLYLATLPL